jgi:hypothetical protein
MAQKRARVDSVEIGGANLGLGDVWGLKQAVREGEEGRSKHEALQLEVLELRKRCQGMLSSVEHTDVEFHFVDSSEVVHAHRAMLCAASEGFRCMFRSGMLESSSGRVQVPPGISVASFKGRYKVNTRRDECLYGILIPSRSYRTFTTNFLVFFLCFLGFSCVDNVAIVLQVFSSLSIWGRSARDAPRRMGVSYGCFVRCTA